MGRKPSGAAGGVASLWEGFEDGRLFTMPFGALEALPPFSASKGVPAPRVLACLRAFAGGGAAQGHSLSPESPLRLVTHVEDFPPL